VEITIWGLGAEPPVAGGQRGFGGGAPNAAAIYQLIPNNNAFLSIFWSKFLLKIVFLNDCKVCWRAPKACAQNCLPSLLRHCLLNLVQYFELAYDCLFSLTSIFCNCANFNRHMQVQAL